MYIALAFLLKEQYSIFGPNIVGKKLMMASYGSGNTMIVLSGQVAEGAPAVIRSWDLQEHLTSARLTSMDEYTQWVNGPYNNEIYNLYLENERVRIPQKSFYLANIREDGYREYNYRESIEEAVDDRIEESQTSGHLHAATTVLG